MNAKRSLFFWIVAVIVAIGVFVGFIHGATIRDAEPLNGVLWMLGSFAVAVLGVFLSWKLKKR